MEPNQFKLNESVHQLMQYNDDIWQKLQDFYYGQNPVSEALAKLNAEDLRHFYDALASNPMRLMELQIKWWQGQMGIYKNFVQRSFGEGVPSTIEDIPGDRRFSHELWKQDPNFDLLRQSYILFSTTIRDMIDVVEGIPDQVRFRLHFFMRQLINAISPSNFFWTNPEILKQTQDEGGENLLRGAKLFQEDILKSGQYLKIRMMRDNAFDVGRDLALTPGQVVFKNEIFELIQYKPQTDQVYQTPLLIVPPFINKYYILDLKEKNSFINWLVQQGHTVFLMSWRNPMKEQAMVAFSDLVTNGVMQAVKVIEDITHEKEVNALGYCMGGTLLAATQAYYTGKRLKNRIKSATYLTTLLDFSEPGELGVFINDPLISAIEAMESQVGYCDGRQLAVTFSLLRENSLYWNYYIENYLKGKEPADFDILYWNGDGTNVTPPVHSFILRNLYLNNELVQPGKIKLSGTGLNLSKVKSPSFFISTKEDHIALWEGTFKGAQALGGEHTLVLGESGHVAGIVNPPAKNKYGYYTNAEPFEQGQSWLLHAQFHPGSWWLYWQQWILPYAGTQITTYPWAAIIIPFYMMPQANTLK
ncbi:class I poly(R)-hydroxyalkanoic acid synthase [Snodgrassella sp. CFCC 13594]|uniref:class I poly(R)-hydroxyalkanoic acid synthase n=1 Tax=Snodgrassella sp. CFCC 13594 TaxID=1775559 RepID=UPI000A4F6181|nr:class I poly(R)-hydroxyalkanoic acid synthase [Snodgrassella sp. CFCC 13594]